MMRAAGRLVSALAFAGAALLPAELQAAACSGWSAWDGFRSRFVSDDGRVVDPATPDRRTTSEGQSYALFFALVGNDRAGFERILRWTENNLADGDLTARLPAWLWGKRDDGSWGVLDANAAADADLWIAYALGEAGRLWKTPKYTAMAQLVAERVLREETADIPGFGPTLLPGPHGFRPGPDVFRLNPSYVPVQLMRRFAALYPQAQWKTLVSTSIDTVVRSSPRGFAPNWVLYKARGGFRPDADSKAIGSYDAVRVYLWAGMLAADDPARPVLLKTLAPAARYVQAHGTPPLQADTRDGKADGAGPAGFSAAMLPFLVASGLAEAGRQQRQRIEVRAPLERDDNYYEQALTLFGLGFADGRYRFARDGSLLPGWTCCSK